jgi:hypothetical protein
MSRNTTTSQCEMAWHLNGYATPLVTRTMQRRNSSHAHINHTIAYNQQLCTQNAAQHHRNYTTGTTGRARTHALVTKKMRKKNASAEKNAPHSVHGMTGRPAGTHDAQSNRRSAHLSRRFPCSQHGRHRRLQVRRDRGGACWHAVRRRGHGIGRRWRQSNVSVAVQPRQQRVRAQGTCARASCNCRRYQCARWGGKCR